MILVECKPDKTLVNILGIPKKEIVHAGNKSGACRRLEKNNRLIGLVDEDPSSIQPPYIKRLKLINNISDFKILHDPKRDNYLIVLSPRLEEWVLKAAREAGVSVEKYGLPSDPERLHAVINLRIDKFRKLVQELRTKSRMAKDLEETLKLL